MFCRKDFKEYLLKLIPSVVNKAKKSQNHKWILGFRYKESIFLNFCCKYFVQAQIAVAIVNFCNKVGDF